MAVKGNITRTSSAAGLVKAINEIKEKIERNYSPIGQIKIERAGGLGNGDKTD